MATKKKAVRKAYGPVPRKATSPRAIAKMQFDNLSHREFWVIVEADRVVIVKQRSGQPATAEMSLPRSVFNCMVDWYERGVLPWWERRKG